MVEANFLPRTLRGRLVLGLLSLCLGVPSGMFIGLLMYVIVVYLAGLPAGAHVPGPGPLGSALLAVLAEFITALFLVSALSLIWSLCTPRWVERLAERAARKTVLLLLLLMIVAGLTYCLA